MTYLLTPPALWPDPPVDDWPGAELPVGGDDEPWSGDPMQTLLNAHYHLMRSKRYWYDDADKAASTILCVLASDMRRELAQPLPDLVDACRAKEPHGDHQD